MPQQQHVCNGLARPADKSMMSRDKQRDMVKTLYIPPQAACSLWRCKEYRSVKEACMHQCNSLIIFTFGLDGAA